MGGRADARAARGAAPRRVHRHVATSRCWPTRSTSRSPRSTASSRSTRTSAPRRRRARRAGLPGRGVPARVAAMRCTSAGARLRRRRTAGRGRGSVLPRACAPRARRWPPAVACSAASTRRRGRAPSSAASLVASPLRSLAGSAPVATASPCTCPRDAAARAAGADEVAAALAAQPGVRVVRNGSRGMLWLEPLVEVATAAGSRRLRPGHRRRRARPARRRPARRRRAPAAPRARRRRCRGCGAAARHVRARRRRSTRAIADDYEAHGGLVGLRRALAMQPGRRGHRGHRQRPARSRRRGVPHRHQVAHRARHAQPTQKYIVCNADEGDSGSFADRMLMEGDPFLLDRGHDHRRLGRRAPTTATSTSAASTPTPSRRCVPPSPRAETRGWLTGVGATGGVLGTDFVFRLHVRVGAGAYICGEETALMESIEGRRGIVRAKPPLPAIEGLWGKPTVINNVLSLAALPSILADGAAAYAALGTGRSRGTQVVQLAGNVARGGIFEAAVRHHGARAGRAVRRRHRQRSPGARRAGGWPAGRVPRARAVRPAHRLRGVRRRRRAARPRQHGRVRRHGRHGSPWPASRWSSAPSSRAASARRAASAALAASS